MLSITRFPGSVAGRSSLVVFNKMVFTVATADTYELDMRKQTAEALAQLDKHLAMADSDKSRLLSCTVYITDMALKPQMNEIWDQWVDMKNPPQRACIGAALEEGDLIEIVAVATTKD
jgi:enamine deaminase RidA (YjgF/YER057c/UK114 family)